MPSKHDFYRLYIHATHAHVNSYSKNGLGFVGFSEQNKHGFEGSASCLGHKEGPMRDPC